MDYLPVFLSLKHQKCLVVGGGAVAARKIELLARSGADITVIAKEISHSIQTMAPQYSIVLKEQVFSETDLTAFKLVVSATNDESLNQRISQMAKTQNVLVNVVDKPALCSFIFPAIIDRSPVIAAVSSGGVSPVLARLLRAKIESVIPPAYGRLALLAQKYRLTVKEKLTPAQRRPFWEKTLQGQVAELVFANRLQDAETLLRNELNNSPQAEGEVYLIGAGPGAADLLTFRALRLMQQADVIVYDRLVSQDILDLARRDAEKIYVGKQRNHHTLPQESINELLAKLAKTGKRVARLKGGDPFIFGRGGEEIETLVQHGVHFQVVPGITAASGCASYAGIPLTHRDYAQSVTFVTGHLKDGSIDLNWQQLAAPNQTVVIYMGLAGLDKICQLLIDNGCAPNLPIAVIQQGTTDQQRVITGTLSSLPQALSTQEIKPPTLIIIGNVVKLQEKLSWFQRNTD